MAQFVEVMKQARRICLEHPGDCDGCPLHDDEWSGCRFDLTEEYLYDDTTERIVLKWAEEHPEPVYPSWDDGWKQLFPESIDTPCPACCGRKYQNICCSNVLCVNCKQRPIPAEIAEKLGIKPKEKA